METSDTTSTEEDAATSNGATPTETPTDTPTEAPEPELVIVNVEADTVAMVGDAVSAAVEVENRGGQTGGTTIEFSFDDNKIEASVEGVPSNGTRTVEEEIRTDGVNTGQYILEVMTPETTETYTIDVIPNQTEPGLYGVVRGVDEASIEGTISFAGRKDGDFNPERLRIDGEQQFAVDHPYERPYSLFPVGFESANIASPEAGPIVYPLAESQEVTDDVVVFDRFEVPPGITTRIKIVDSASDPIEGFDSVNLRDQNGAGLGPRRLTTDSGGYITDGNTTEIPIGPAPDGELTVTARSSGGGSEVLGTVAGTENQQEFIIQVSDLGRFRE